MSDNIDEAIVMLSKLTHRVSNITIFSIIIIVIFILGPFTITIQTKKFIKLVISIMLGIMLYTNYIGITNIEDKFQEEISSSDQWKTIESHITYNYIYSSLLGIFIIYLLYTCI